MTRSYDVFFEWRGALKSVRATDVSTHREESSTKLRAVIWRESAYIAREITESSHLDKADGSFALTLAGCAEPYMVTWNSANVPLVSKLLGAAETWNVEELRKILATGINVNARDLANHTALLLAASDPRKRIHEQPELRAKVNWEPDVEALKLLLDGGADPNIKGNFGVTPLMLADDSSAPILLTAGGDVNARDDFGRTPLMYMAEKSEANIIRLESTKGADVNARDMKGWTALMYATQKGSIQTVKTLLESGSDRNAKNDDGQTAFAIAVERAERDPQFLAAVNLLSSRPRSSRPEGR